MRCRDAERLCTGYVDGELDDRVASALRGHLRTCGHCRALVEDEAAVRDAAADLEPLEPPPQLWSGVEARLAEAEIADAEKSRLWFWWQGLRQHALPGAVAVAAVVALLVWNSRRNGDPSAGRPDIAASDPAVEAGASERAIAPGAAATDALFLEARRSEVLAADATYVSAIADLAEVVKVERGAWSAGAKQAFDVRFGELDATAKQYVHELGLDRPSDPESRDALYATYRAQIGLMQHAVLEELLR